MADEPTELIERFSRMVARDGGELWLLSAEAGIIRVGYRPGRAEADCADGSCTLPQAELAQLMTETAARQLPGARVVVEVIA